MHHDYCVLSYHCLSHPVNLTVTANECSCGIWLQSLPVKFLAETSLLLQIRMRIFESGFDLAKSLLADH